MFVNHHVQQQRVPGRIERQAQGPPVQELLRQWDWLSIRDEGLLYRTYQRSDGGEEVLVFRESLQGEVFEQLHTHDGHQGTEHTIELIRQ